MMKLPFTDLGKQLRPRYRLPITILLFSCTFASFIPTILFCVLLCHLFDLPLNAPIKDLPGGPLVAVLTVVFMIAAMWTGYLASFHLLAVILKRRHGWSDDKIHSLMYDCEIPPHWLKPRIEKATRHE